MTNEQQEKLKAIAEENYCNQASTIGQAGLYSPCEPSLMEKINSQLYRSQIESNKLNQLSELKYLLDKNPEVARILDLMNIVR